MATNLLWLANASALGATTSHANPCYPYLDALSVGVGEHHALDSQRWRPEQRELDYQLGEYPGLVCKVSFPRAWRLAPSSVSPFQKALQCALNYNLAAINAIDLLRTWLVTWDAGNGWNSHQRVQQYRTTIYPGACKLRRCTAQTSLRTLAITAAFLMDGCEPVPQKVAMNDPQVLVKAATSFDRASYGFSPIPQNADVRLEQRSPGHYHAMLHITTKTSRTITFRKENCSYVWIGEQESFQGPSKYKSQDGIFNEASAGQSG